MSLFWSEIVHKLVPYTPGEQPVMCNLVKLNTNENPFAPAPEVLTAMKLAVNADLRLYPDPEAEHLKSTIANYYGLQTDQIFVGNGSDEVLAHAFAAFFQGKTDLLMPDITYSFYPVYCQLYQVQPKIIPLDQKFQINPADYINAKAGIILPNPNAPTGCLLSLNQIRQLLETNPESLVLIDEAYIDFGGQSATSLISHYPNLLVTQTLSKSRSLAGMRIGLAMGQAELIEGLQRVKNSFNSYPLDRIAQVAAIAAFKHESYFQQTCQQIIQNRDELTNQLKNLGFEVLPSAANFVFARHRQLDAEMIYQHLYQQGVLVRYFNKPRINQFLRISIGTQIQQHRLIEVLSEIVN